MRFLTFLFMLGSLCSVLILPLTAQHTTIYSYQTTVSNVHIVQQGETLLMIDSGTKGMRKRLSKYLAEEGLGFADIDYLILTHAHPDHAGNAAYLQRTFGTKIVAGAGDADLLASGKLDEVCFTNFAGRAFWPFIPHKFEPLTADFLLADTLDMSPWGIEGKIYPMQGHTDGSLIVQVGHRAFVGDLIRGRPTNKTKPTLHYYMCDVEGNQQDILRLCQDKNITIWFTGHFGELDPREVEAVFR